MDPTPEAPDLARALESSQPRARLLAMRAALERRDPQAAEILVGHLPSELDPSARQAAIHVIGQLGGIEHAAAVARFLTDRDPALRRRAVEALGRIGDPATQPLLVRLLAVESEQEVRDLCAKVLTRLGSQALIGLFKRMLRSSHTANRAAAVAVCQLFDSPLVVPVLKLAYLKEEGGIKERALEGLRRLAGRGQESAAMALADIAQTSPETVREEDFLFEPAGEDDLERSYTGGPGTPLDNAHLFGSGRMLRPGAAPASKASAAPGGLPAELIEPDPALGFASPSPGTAVDFSQPEPAAPQTAGPAAPQGPGPAAPQAAGPAASHAPGPAAPQAAGRGTPSRPAPEPRSTFASRSPESGDALPGSGARTRAPSSDPGSSGGRRSPAPDPAKAVDRSGARSRSAFGSELPPGPPAATVAPLEPPPRSGAGWGRPVPDPEEHPAPIADEATGDPAPADAEPPEAAEPEQPRTKPCRNCGRAIPRNAVECRHCDEVFDRPPASEGPAVPFALRLALGFAMLVVMAAVAVIVGHFARRGPPAARSAAPAEQRIRPG